MTSYALEKYTIKRVALIGRKALKTVLRWTNHNRHNHQSIFRAKGGKCKTA